MEQIKSYDDNIYFQSIAKQFECRLNASELKTLKYLTHQQDESENNQCPWIFFKGFKQWYINQYIRYNDAISNTARSETLFDGTETDELHQNIFQNTTTPTTNHENRNIYQIWQTMLGIHFINWYKSNEITKKDILGRISLIDITKQIHFERTKDEIIQSSLMRLCIVHNNIFKITLKLFAL